MYEKLNSTKNIERNEIQVGLIKSALTDLKNRIKNMSENGKRIEQPDKLVDIVEKVLGFNERYQEGRGLKILTPDQMLSRFIIYKHLVSIIEKWEQSL